MLLPHQHSFLQTSLIKHTPNPPSSIHSNLQWLFSSKQKTIIWIAPLIFNPLYTANHPNIFDITETWLTSTNSDNEMIPLRYQIHHRDLVSLGGGIMIAVSDSPTPSSYPLMLMLLQK